MTLLWRKSGIVSPHRDSNGRGRRGPLRPVPVHGEFHTLLVHNDDTTKNLTSESASASQCLRYGAQVRSPVDTVTILGVPRGHQDWTHLHGSGRRVAQDLSAWWGKLVGHAILHRAKYMRMYRPYADNRLPPPSARASLYA